MVGSLDDKLSSPGASTSRRSRSLRPTRRAAGSAGCNARGCISINIYYIAFQICFEKLSEQFIR